MTIRETLNEKLIVAYSLAAAGVAIVGLVLLLQFSGGGSNDPPDQSYYSTNDGRTFFAASRTLVPPFEHDGQVAYAAAVFECDRERFVGFLERYVPELREELVALEGRSLGPELNMWASRGGTEVKRPGGDVWTPSDAGAAYDEIVEVLCPGDAKRAEPVFP